MFGCAYYRVAAPFRVYAHVGVSESNTWVGSSRVFTTVKEAWNARPGDVLHVLPGGTFLSRGKECWEVGLKAPAPFFEGKYHYTPPERVAENLAKTGRLEACEKPALAIDFKGLRNKVSSNRLPPLRPEVFEIEPSPEAEFLKGLSEPFEAAVTTSFPHATIVANDFRYDSGPKRVVRFDDHHVGLEVISGGAVIVSASSAIELNREPIIARPDGIRVVRFDNRAQAEAELPGLLGHIVDRVCADPGIKLG